MLPSRSVRAPRAIRLFLVVAAVGLSAGVASAHPVGPGGGSGGAGFGPGSSGGNPGGSSGSQGTRVSGPTTGPLSVNGMWIWYVSKADGGKVSAIIATAHRYQIGSLMIKAGDGSQRWSQFSSKLVNALHAAGLQVCAWQYVYGDHPIAEAKVGAAAVNAGADCLLIDAEANYEGKYVQAQQYIRELRHLVGPTFPVGLASFPYVDFHPSLPYSVFMEPGGAQYNVPQMYWPDIQTTVDEVYAHTYSFNSVYAHPIAPLGEVAGDPPPRQVERFRKLAAVYGATGVSWWDWQEASVRDWQAVGAAVGSLSAQPQVKLPILSRHGKGTFNQGDLVVWAQEHLISAGYQVNVTGTFGTSTQSAVRSFQTAQGIPVSGQVDPTTWLYLLRYPAAAVTWTAQGAHPGRAARMGRSGRGLVLLTPRSARLSAKAYEIPAHFGAG